jgi:hypothetical protein
VRNRPGGKYDIPDVLDDCPGHTPLWATAWSQAEPFNEPDLEGYGKQPDRHCKCGRVVTGMAAQCWRCYKMEIRRKAAVRNRAHALALRVLAGERLRLDFSGCKEARGGQRRGATEGIV